MTYLDCSVTGCVYNKEHCCCKGDIHVEGSKAEQSSQTCCGSFKERGSNSCSNTVGTKSKEIDVTCDACNCGYNKDNKCSAEHIGIAGGNACTCGETECASFCSCC